jgi:hypothetical protein
MSWRSVTPWILALCATTIVAAACSGSSTGPDADGDSDGDGDGDADADADADGDGDGDGDADGGLDADELPDVGPNYDAFFAEDPPPQYCGPDDRPPPELPGGTPECPDDKNREGCACPNPGEDAPCWPGLRVDRNRGICHDGTTTCEPIDEFGYGRWGACEGYLLPEEGATRGAQACNCFSGGRWVIDNLVPCFVTSSDGSVCAVSTFIDDSRQASCPTSITGCPADPEPGTVFSANRLLTDCSGQFRLCLTLKAGNAEAASSDDCVVSETCTETWYEAPAEGDPPTLTELDPLPSWSSSDAACAQQFMDEGGYAEMSVVGTSIECEEIAPEDAPYVFNVITYCPLYCNDPGSEDLPECERCGNGATGSF